MKITTFTPSLLKPDDYLKYAAAWVNAISDPATDDLSQYFTAAEDDKTKLLTDRVLFPAGSIAQLVSTVGASTIKARFILMPVTPGSSHLRFSLVLFATDSFNTRLSSYYVSEPYWEGNKGAGYLLKKIETYLASGNSYLVDGELDPNSPVPFEGAVPDALATSWLFNWYLAAMTVTAGGKLPSALFNGAYGFLRGYSFDLEDFLAPLRKLSAFLLIENPDSPVAVKLGLHEYSYASPNGGDIDTKTLGLIVQYPTGSFQGKDKNATADSSFATTNVSDSGIDDPLYYDMSSPCPPSC